MKSPAKILQGEARVTASGLSKHYLSAGHKVSALDNVSIQVKPSEMVVLLGPSGCGKTTLLRSIAGLEQPQAGQITIDAKTVYSAERRIWSPPEKRGVSMVFQSYALWPHMTVEDNIGFPLAARKVESASVLERVRKVMDVVGLSAMAGRMPSQLSGGQQQRVALARAIVGNDGIVLFDEPLSNVDAQVRDQIRREIVRLQEQLGFSALYVTHDQTEATALADTLVVMDHGKIMQIGSPSSVYDSPTTRYVATFMGPANELKGKVAAKCSGGPVEIDTPSGLLVGDPRAGADTPGASVTALFRPETVLLSQSRLDGPNNWFCAITRRTFMGAFIELTLLTQDSGVPFELTALVTKNTFLDASHLWIQIPPSAVWVFAQ